MFNGKGFFMAKKRKVFYGRQGGAFICVLRIARNESNIFFGRGFMGGDCFMTRGFLW